MSAHTNFQKVILQVLERCAGKSYAQDKVREWKAAGVKSDGDAFLWATTHLDPKNFATVMEAIGWDNCQPGMLRRLSACIRDCKPQQEVTAA